MTDERRHPADEAFGSPVDPRVREWIEDADGETLLLMVAAFAIGGCMNVEDGREIARQLARFMADDPRVVREYFLAATGHDSETSKRARRVAFVANRVRKQNPEEN